MMTTIQLRFFAAFAAAAGIKLERVGREGTRVWLRGAVVRTDDKGKAVAACGEYHSLNLAAFPCPGVPPLDFGKPPLILVHLDASGVMPKSACYQRWLGPLRQADRAPGWDACVESATFTQCRSLQPREGHGGLPLVLTSKQAAMQSWPRWLARVVEQADAGEQLIPAPPAELCMPSASGTSTDHPRRPMFTADAMWILRFWQGPAGG